MQAIGLHVQVLQQFFATVRREEEKKKKKLTEFLQACISGMAGAIFFKSRIARLFFSFLCGLGKKIW